MSKTQQGYQSPLPIPAQPKLENEIDSTAIMSALGYELISLHKKRYTPTPGIFYFAGCGTDIQIRTDSTTAYARLEYPDFTLSGTFPAYYEEYFNVPSNASLQSFIYFSTINGGTVPLGSIINFAINGPVYALDISYLTGIIYNIEINTTRLIAFEAPAGTSSANGWFVHSNRLLKKFLPPKGWRAATTLSQLYIPGNALDAQALNEIFTRVGTVSDGKSYINVQGNPGARTCDPTIATSKGWLVYT
jgi:hypothetical protein